MNEDVYEVRAFTALYGSRIEQSRVRIIVEPATNLSDALEWAKQFLLPRFAHHPVEITFTLSKPMPFDQCTMRLDGSTYFTVSPRGDSSDAARIQAALDWLDTPLADEAVTERLTASELLKHGGEWLGVARSWIQRIARNGSDVTWGSGDRLDCVVRVDDVERLAAEVAAAAMAPQPNEATLSARLRALWEAQREAATLRAEVERLRAALRAIAMTVGASVGEQASTEIHCLVADEAQIVVERLMDTFVDWKRARNEAACKRRPTALLKPSQRMPSVSVRQRRHGAFVRHRR